MSSAEVVLNYSWDITYPCWYVEYDKENEAYKIGIHSQYRVDECLVKVTEIKNYNKKFEALGELGFHNKLLELYKQGQQTLLNWLEG